MKGKKPEGSGRKSGTPNKRTAALEERLAELGYDPLEAAVAIATGTIRFKVENNVVVPPTPDQQCRAILELMQYKYSKKKAIEVSGGPDANGDTTPVMVTFDSFPGWVGHSKNPDNQKGKKDE